MFIYKKVVLHNHLVSLGWVRKYVYDLKGKKKVFFINLACISMETIHSSQMGWFTEMFQLVFS